MDWVEAKQIKCEGLVSANWRLLNARFHDLGGQLLKLKEQEFNNGLDRQNIKDQIVELQTRSENNQVLTLLFLSWPNIFIFEIFMGFTRKRG